MLSVKTRRISGLLSALVLAAGLITHGFAGSDMVVKSAIATATDMPMLPTCPCLMKRRCPASATAAPAMKEVWPRRHAPLFAAL